MKRLKSATTEQYELEVVQCDCGFHLGIDASYLLQVGDLVIPCPVCKTPINTKTVCPENEEDEGADPNNDEFNCYACGKVFDIEDSIKVDDVLVCIECSKKW